MAVFKCKMCGASLEVSDSLIATCDFCGSQQTLPKLNGDKLERLYERASNFRQGNEFDKAMAVYEEILNESPSDSESYWSIVLCKYGVEYVEDPKTYKRVPTINRAQYTSIFDDNNYKLAIQYADISQKLIYEQEARAINEIQKGILDVSSKEEPFDVFICYKETDEYGQRTRDSVYATELYHELTKEGFKVFFARITLEDKLGSAYEPYIFAALNSAKVMVAIGTKPEHFEAVWVKNEWSRYLTLIKNGEKKYLIPAYKDMDPYDLPKEFSHLQAQDMNKLGFMPDLIRGIKKLAGVKPQPAYQAPLYAQPSYQAPARQEPAYQAPKAATAPAQSSASVDALLRRAAIFLDDKDFVNASAYCEKVLDRDPENAQAYIYKLQATVGCQREEDLASTKKPLDGYASYRNAVRFADEQTAARLVSYNQQIQARVDSERRAAEEKKREEDERKKAYLQKLNDLNHLSAEKSKATKRVNSLIEEKKQNEKTIQRTRKKIFTKKDKALAILAFVYNVLMLPLTIFAWFIWEVLLVSAGVGIVMLVLQWVFLVVTSIPCLCAFKKKIGIIFILIPYSMFVFDPLIVSLIVLVLGIVALVQMSGANQEKHKQTVKRLIERNKQIPEEIAKARAQAEEKAQRLSDRQNGVAPAPKEEEPAANYYEDHKTVASLEETAYVCKNCGATHMAKEVPIDFECPFCQSKNSLVEKTYQTAF